MKTVIFALLFLAIFGLSSAVRAGEYATLSDVDYPATVEIGETFEIIVSFDYPRDIDCLWGDHIYLYYDVGVIPVIDYRQNVPVALPETPKPVNIIIEIDTSTVVCEVNDTFIFRVEYTTGLIIGDTVYKSGDILTETSELTIVEAEEVSVFALSFIIPLLFLSTIIVIRKRK